MTFFLRFSLLTLLGLALAVLTLSAAPGLAQQGEEEISPATFNRGIILYQRYCSNCHGDGAQGDGRIAHLLKVPPSDLTQLALKNGGEFPIDDARKTIDGRKGIMLHGTREMPIWGQVFKEGEGPEAEAEAQKKINDLIGYLKAIQETPGD